MSINSLTLLDVQLGRDHDWSQTWGSDKGGASASLSLHNTVHARVGLFDVLFQAEATNVATFRGYLMDNRFDILDAGASLTMGFRESRCATPWLDYFTLHSLILNLSYNAHHTEYKAPIPQDLLDFVELLGDVVAGVSNIASFIESVAQKVQLIIAGFRTAITAILTPIEAAIDAAKDFTTTAAEITALADIEEPLAGWLVPDIGAPAVAHDLNDARSQASAMLPGITTLSDATTLSNMQQAVTNAQQVNETVR